ncbi:hypothetical protein A9Q84_13815 [Halobacteriovorax marinus]|uniref:Uncharacterized protein n=1 Tax=Halobacteriovorax marinus TaxID=97084 RepID=A0A1Y5F8X2_9BACT|nr:hypothetical protein A9Q84_13815 [Halobacteriovorax marinus]
MNLNNPLLKIDESKISDPQELENHARKLKLFTESLIVEMRSLRAKNTKDAYLKQEFSSIINNITNNKHINAGLSSFSLMNRDAQERGMQSESEKFLTLEKVLIKPLIEQMNIGKDLFKNAINFHDSKNIFKFEELTLDLVNRLIITDNTNYPLTPLEMTLLTILVKNANCHVKTTELPDGYKHLILKLRRKVPIFNTILESKKRVGVRLLLK